MATLTISDSDLLEIQVIFNRISSELTIESQLDIASIMEKLETSRIPLKVGKTSWTVQELSITSIRVDTRSDKESARQISKGLSVIFTNKSFTTIYRKVREIER